MKAVQHKVHAVGPRAMPRVEYGAESDEEGREEGGVDDKEQEIDAKRILGEHVGTVDEQGNGTQVHEA